MCVCICVRCACYACVRCPLSCFLCALRCTGISPVHDAGRVVPLSNRQGQARAADAKERRQGVLSGWRPPLLIPLHRCTGVQLLAAGCLARNGSRHVPAWNNWVVSAPALHRQRERESARARHTRPYTYVNTHTHAHAPRAHAHGSTAAIHLSPWSFFLARHTCSLLSHMANITGLSVRLNILYKNIYITRLCSYITKAAFTSPIHTALASSRVKQWRTLCCSIYEAAFTSPIHTALASSRSSPTLP